VPIFFIILSGRHVRHGIFFAFYGHFHVQDAGANAGHGCDDDGHDGAIAVTNDEVAF